MGIPSIKSEAKIKHMQNLRRKFHSGTAQTWGHGDTRRERESDAMIRVRLPFLRLLAEKVK